MWGPPASAVRGSKAPHVLRGRGRPGHTGKKEMAKVAGILGKKVGMTQLFDSRGEVRPATVLQAGPCVVTQSKTDAKDGYVAAQLGLVEFVKDSRLTKPMRGHFAKNNLPPVK